MPKVEIKPEVQPERQSRPLVGRYAQCPKYGSKLRLNIEICESKCQDKDRCRDYIESQKHKTPRGVVEMKKGVVE